MVPRMIEVTRRVVRVTTRGVRWLTIGLVVSACGLIPSTAVHGRAARTPNTLAWASRSELAAQAQLLEREANARGVKKADRAMKLEMAQDLRDRITNGDFIVGDRIALAVVRDSGLRDTVSVREGLLVSIQDLPELSLQGVLRSELQQKITEHVGKYIRDPVVRTSPLTRVSIVGAIGRPGFYFVPPDQPLGEVMMSAGMAPTADLDKSTVMRGKRILLDQRETRSALKQGTTIDQLAMRSGDEIHVGDNGTNSGRNAWQYIQIGTLILSIGLALLNFLRWYYAQQG